MSSPLSSLRKNKRVPLPDYLPDGERMAHNVWSDTDYEEKSFHKTFPQIHPPAENTAENLSSSRSKLLQKKKVKAPSDFELMASMMQKIALLERKVTSQALDVQQKARRIAALEEKLNLLQEPKGNKEHKEQLVQLCLKLQTQVWEMEKFLGDYGMIWVGSDEGQEKVESQNPVKRIDKKIFQINFDLVIQNIQDLNLEAGDGESQVTAVPGGAKLTRNASVPLWLYKNGLFLCSGPFRCYQEPKTQEFVQDLMDGFFPSELQKRFPNGVPFQGSTKLSMEKFLQKLPESVVRGGKVISIRDSVQAHLLVSIIQSANPSPIPPLTFPFTCEGNPRSSSESGSDSRGHNCPAGLKKQGVQTNSSGIDVTTLRVKSEDGLNTYVMKMYVSETIGELRRFLDINRGPGASRYDIISTFPLQCYGDDTLTLLACGLYPNGVLLLRPCASHQRYTDSKQ
ncbi:hypothetical protein DNTS_021169 [Danionella cerebrum]|uniref:UBX domain-containing protein 11 n=1 Tax=Danionella cerebrum TaxID=2873325 RepID=A0A553R1L9_9TELE|nr:hypothetical protein DNTS_021169 [Danionella translucida]